MLEEITLAVKAAAAEYLSTALTELQREHGLTFGEAVEALRGALDNAYSDEAMPGGGYVIVR